MVLIIQVLKGYSAILRISVPGQLQTSYSEVFDFYAWVVLPNLSPTHNPMTKPIPAARAHKSKDSSG